MSKMGLFSTNLKENLCIGVFIICILAMSIAGIHHSLTKPNFYDTKILIEAETIDRFNETDYRLNETEHRLNTHYHSRRKSAKVKHGDEKGYILTNID